MKTLEFEADKLPDLQELGNQLFTEETDLRSWGYKRILVRPQINWLRIFLNLAAAGTVCIALYFGLCVLSVDKSAALAATLAALLVYVLIRIKSCTICLVKIYQRLAPECIRNACRFEPSCSQYMILSIEKYGFWRGFPRGVKRILRCTPKNGGFDYP